MSDYERIKLLTCNTNKSRDWAFFKDSSSNLKSFIQEAQADIVFLQEVIGMDIKRKIANSHFEALADELWHDFAYMKNSVSPNKHYGNAILSRFPIMHYENINISTNKYERRGLLYAQIEIPQGESSKRVDLYCTHLNLLQNGRDKQLEIIITEINNRSKDTPFIISGDFNDWNLRIGKGLESKLGVTECGKCLTGEYLKTFPSFFPVLCLDRIFVHGFEVLNTPKIKSKTFYSLSDHIPILAEVKLNG